MGSTALDEEGPSRRWTLTAVLMLAPVSAGGFVLGGMSVPWAVSAAVVFLAACVLRWRAQTRRHGRAVQVERLRTVLSRETSTIPERLRLKVSRWDGTVPVVFTVRYSELFADEDSAKRLRVEAQTAQKVGVPLAAKWKPSRDTVVFRHDPTGSLTPEPLREPETDPFIADIEEALAPVIRGAVEVSMLEEDDQGPLKVQVRYPASFKAHSEELRFEVAQAVARHAEDRWKPSWDTRRKVVVFERRPALPKVIKHPLSTDLDPMRLPLGVDEHGDTAYWDLLMSPHMMAVGSTGSGKTGLVGTVITEAALRGFDIVIVDGKGTTLAGYRHWPGVIQVGLGDAEPMHEAMIWAEETMRRRYQDVREGRAKSRDFKPMLVILDEAAEFATEVARWWKDTPEVDDQGREKMRKGKPESMDAWRSIARLGREGRVHLLIGLQQAAAEFFNGTETRSNIALSVGMGPLDKEGAHMAFGRADVGRDLPQGLRGRATVLYRGQEPREVQVYWSGEPEATGELESEDALRILAPLRAMAQERIDAERAARPCAIEKTPAGAITVPLEDLTGDEIIEVDIEGRRVQVTFVSLDEAASGDEDRADLLVRIKGEMHVLGDVSPRERVPVLD